MKITNKPDQVIVEHEGLTFVFDFNTLYKDILKCEREEVKYFVENILPRYELTLDELE